MQESPAVLSTNVCGTCTQLLELVSDVGWLHAVTNPAGRIGCEDPRPTLVRCKACLSTVPTSTGSLVGLHSPPGYSPSSTGSTGMTCRGTSKLGLPPVDESAAWQKLEGPATPDE